MTIFGLSVAEATLYLSAFNGLAVPLILWARRWPKRVERRLGRIERVLQLEPLQTNH